MYKSYHQLFSTNTLVLFLTRQWSNASTQSWGNPVQNLSQLCGLVATRLHTLQTHVYNHLVIHQSVNNFSTQSYTAFFGFPICYNLLLHTFHITYNNHSSLKELVL